MKNNQPNKISIKLRWAFRCLLAIVLSLSAKDNYAEIIYQETGGVVLMEAENTQSSLGLWTSGAGFTGFSGSGFIEFTGNSPAGHGTPKSPLRYTFKVSTEGDYALLIRGRSRLLPGEPTDISNDAWVRLEGDYTVGAGGPPNMSWLNQDTKMFVGRGGNGDWGWASKFDINHVQPSAIYHFKAGQTYTLTISGRSTRFNIDRILFVNSLNSQTAAKALTTESATIDNNGAVERYEYEGLKHFEELDKGDVVYYKDAVRNALAINASVVADRDKYARASTTFTGISGLYDVNLSTLSESDGECTYRFLVNGVAKGSFTNARITAADEYRLQYGSFKAIQINNGDQISVESNTHTNGLVPEGGGTAWARGRWRGVSMTPALFQGRVAVVADGNYRDSDDIIGTPVTLAILKAMGLADKLVHYSHSCDLRKGGSDPGGEYREVEMQTSADGTALRWGGFDHIRFYNCIKEKAATIEDLKNKINSSTATDPLWIIEAGEPDIMWEAVNKSDVAKRKYIHIVTHHPANDVGDDYDLKDVIALGILNANVHEIPDQNALLKTPLSDWHWARDATDNRLNWLWDRGVKAQSAEMEYAAIVGKFDCSDAGMVYYWATINSGGDELCDVPKLKALFESYLLTAPAGVSFKSPKFGDNFLPGSNVSVEAQVASGTSVQKVELFLDDVLVSAITSAPFEWGTTAYPNAGLENIAAGNHVLKLVLTETNSATTISSINITSSTPVVQEPFTGTPIAISGVIEGENYDKGGQGLAYHDSNDGNTGNVYRTDNVDIGTLGNPSDGKYVIGYTATGEWLEYTINVATTGTYDFDVHYSSGRAGGGKIGAEFKDEGIVLFNNVALPQTANWVTYDRVPVENVSLTAGTHVLRINVVSAAFNLDRIEIVAKALPVELISFTAKADDSGVKISWEVASELNNDKFVVQKSENGRDYADLATVKGKGTSNITALYSVRDNHPQKENYYKLLQYDFNGKITEKGVRHAKFTLTNNSVAVYPNPSSTGVFTLVNESKWHVLNLTGVEVLKGEGNQVDLSSFQKGLYIIKTDQSSTKVLSK